MGRNKIKIEKIKNDRNRLVTFIKRKRGLIKKAMELALHCDADVFVAVVSHENPQLSIFSNDPNPETFTEKYLKSPIEPIEFCSLSEYSTLFSQNENSNTVSTKEVTNIADTLETQATEIKQINDGIEQINDVVQTNSATSEECAAASQEMSSEAENLREMIRKFKVAENRN